MQSSVGVVILAAGGSTRLGKPKQKLSFQGETLLQRAIYTARQTACDPVIVVLGAHAEQISQTIHATDVLLTQNPDWQKGMASSIRCGLTALLEAFPAISAAILMVCDQPFVTANHLQHLINTRAETSKGIVASAYEDTIGTPVLFDKAYFQDLLNLQGQEGARKILRQHTSALTSVALPMGHIDIDTQQDYDKLLSDSYSK